MTTVDNFDFTGGTGGTGGDVGGGVRVVRPRSSATRGGGGNAAPGDGAGSWVDPARVRRGRPAAATSATPRATSSAAGHQQLEPVALQELPARRPAGALQFRVEAYNLLNHTQWSTLDNTVRFDATGAQVNQQFGKATAARNSRIMQGSIRFTF